MATSAYRRWEWRMVFVFSVGFALLNSLHVIIPWFNNAPGETFTGIDHSFADYFLYAAQMAQGVGGRWIFSDHLFTNEPVAPTWYYWFNVALGHIGGIAGLTPFVTYNVSLLFLVFILCLIWYCLIQTLYPTNRLLRLSSFFMILTMTNWYWKGELLGQFWFSPAPVFNRLGGVPYQVFQNILFILLAIVFAQLLNMKSDSRIMKYEFRSMGKTFWSSSIIHNSIFIILFAIIAGLANPVQMVLFVAAATVTTAYVFTRRTHVSESKHHSTVALGAVVVAGAVGAWMTNQEFVNQPVFTAARAWELAQWVPNTLAVLLVSIGPILFFIPFGLGKAFTKGDTLRILLVSYGLLSFLLFLSPIARLLHLSPVRLLHPVPYAASLAILATEGMLQLSGILRRATKHRVSLRALQAVLVALYLIFTLPAIYRQLIDRITPARNPQLLMDTIYNHVPAPIVEALGWLRQDTPRQPVVLVDPLIPIEVLVPPFTGKVSFTGHPIHTLYPDVKEALRQQFFTGLMSSPQMFLSDHRIGYIIASPTRMLPPLPPSLVTEVYKNSSVTIYKSSTFTAGY